jgi:3-deoxy-D-manno-octulosonate 8-phosphate phosphatase (KDO 8-P phosphatase)
MRVAEAREVIPAEVAKRIRLVGLDVDGVLTDGGIYLGATDDGARVETKRYDIQDGLGIKMIQEAGITVAIVTGRESHSVRLRAEELGIEELHQDRTAAKLRIFEEILARLGIGWDEVAFVGDDLPDLPILRRAGLPAVVGNATSDARACAKWTATKHGGRGAVREFAEALLHARGEWHTAVEKYVRDREAGL